MDRHLEAPWVGDPSYGRSRCENCGQRDCECCECGAGVDDPHAPGCGFAEATDEPDDFVPFADFAQQRTGHKPSPPTSQETTP
jgi:hypothetical protein